MNLVKVISTNLNDLNQRIVKFFCHGPSDVQTSRAVAPHGVDSNPVKGMVALYAKTGIKGKTVIVGYINVNQLAAPGELRLYSTNAQGELKTYQHFKDNGVIEIAGDDDNMVRYSELKKGYDDLKADHNALVQKFNTHVHPGVTVGTGATATTVTIADPSTADISAAKIENIKTNKS